VDSGAQPAKTSRATAERWAQVRALLESALEQETAWRAEFLKQACGQDYELLAETEALLHVLDESPSFMKEPISGAIAVRMGAPEDTLVGSSVGPWKLLRHIGTGGTASVYAAARSDREFRKVVAVKIIKSGMEFEEILRRFRTERQILAGLDHPNITRLLDGGTTAAGLPYLVMEYVEGMPIRKYSDTSRLSVTERLNLFCTVCSAVEYAHRNLVVHRDLKPANILVTAQGVPKLLDFGIAKLLRPESAGYSVQFTQPQNRMLTPEYASPEQVRGDPITTASDVYSLGVVLYELLTGQRPYRLKTRTASEIEQAICEWDPERPSTMAARLESVNGAEATPARLSRRLRGDLDAIVLTALRKEPQRRYTTVDRLSEDIGRHLRGLPVTASGNTWSYRLGKFAARHKAGVAVTGLLALVLMSASVVSTYFARQAQRQKQSTIQLAGIMLGEFDAAMKSGITPARKASLDKTLASLNQLSSNASNDPDLRALLFTAYLKTGDLQGNIYESNLGDGPGARQSYERALALATQPSEIAQTAIRLGDIAYNSGDRRAALGDYQRAEQSLEQDVRKVRGQALLFPDLTRVWYKIGLAQSQLGDLRGALDSYQHELRLAQQGSASFPSSLDARRDLAVAEEHVGDILLKTADSSQGLVYLERSLLVYQELQKLDPDSPVRRRDVALGLLSVAGVLRQRGDLPRAEENYRSSLQVIGALVSEDPQNEQYQRDRNSILHAVTEVLYEEGKLAESRQLTVYALSVLRPLIAKPAPSSHDLYQYCWDLLTTRFKELHRPQEALHLSQQAVELTHGADPGLLNVMALAWEENGDMDKAIAAARQALALYPASEPTTPGTKRADIAATLARFEKSLARPSHQK
jgi:serine/threonine protein kinase